MGRVAFRLSSTTAACALALGALAACTLRTPDEAPAPRAEVVSVVVEPASARVQPGETLQFHAEVTGTGVVPQGVLWRADCESCAGDDLLTQIDATGLYRAPRTPPRATRLVRISAASVVATDVIATAVVEVPAAAVNVTPVQAEAFPGDLVQFRATVDGTADGRLEWSAEEGSVDADGLYRAPSHPFDAHDRVFATSPVLGFDARGEATVALSLRPPILTATSGPAAPGDALTVLGTGFDVRFFDTRVEVLFPDGLGGALPVIAGEMQPDRLTATVPPGVVGGPLRVRFVTPDRPTAVSEAIPFERAPRLRVHASRSELSAGEVTRVDVTFLGVETSFPLTFETDLGSMDGNVFAAPAVLDLPARANVRACVTGTNVCSGTTVTVRPFLVTPSPALVPAGGSLSLSAQRGGAPIAADFSIGGGGGTVAPGGLFEAPTAFADAGGSWLLVDDGAAVAPVPVGVTGLVPGFLARAESDLGDAAAMLRSGIPWGASARRIAIGGGRAYVAAVPIGSASAASWIDVYDLGDPLRPAWLGAVETAFPAGELHLAQGRLYVLSRYSAVQHLEVFDLSSALPVRVARYDPPFPGAPLGPLAIDGERLYTFGDIDPVTGGLPVAIHRLSEGPLPSPRMVVLYPPELSLTQLLGWAATAHDGRAWAIYPSSTSGQWLLAAWDLDADPPALLGTTQVERPFSGVQVRGPFLVAPPSGCLDRRPAVPVHVPCGFDGTLVAEEGSRFVEWNDGIALLDLADPLAPSKGGTVPAASARGALAGGLFYGAEGSGGIAIYDLGTDGGPRLRASVLQFEASSLTAWTIAGSFLYATGSARPTGGFSGAWDLGSTPPSRTWLASLTSPGRGIAVAGDLLLLAGESGVDVYSLADPALPSLVTTIPLAGTALAAQAPLAFVGTSGGEVVALDLSTPGAPIELGRAVPRAGLPVRAIEAAAPGYLAVALGSVWAADGDLAVLDVRAPDALQVLALAGLAKPVFDLAMDGSVALLGTATALVTMDLADPALPAVRAVVPLASSTIAPYEDDGGLRSVTLSSGIAWVVTSVPYPAGWVRGFDVRNSSWPRLVVQAGLGGLSASADGLVIDGVRAFSVSRSSYAWSELDLSRPRNVALTEHPAPQPPPGASIPY